MRLKFSTANCQCDITEPFIVEQIAQIFGQLAFGNFELNNITLSRDIDAVGHHAHFAEYCQLVLGQKTIGFVQQKVSPNELFEAPIFALNKSVCSVKQIREKWISISSLLPDAYRWLVVVDTIDRIVHTFVIP